MIPSLAGKSIVGQTACLCCCGSSVRQQGVLLLPCNTCMLHQHTPVHLFFAAAPQVHLLAPRSCGLQSAQFAFRLHTVCTGFALNLLKT